MEHSIYLSGIKKALRAREINYAELAEHLRMTESGVKKMLNGKDISFRRVLQICDVLNVLPGQLFSASEEAIVPVLQLSDKQEDALINDRRLLMVYWLFTIEKLAPAEICKRQGISDADLIKSLRRLLRLELVMEKRGIFSPKHNGKFRWPDDSKLVKMLNQEWSQLTLNKALKAKNRQCHRLIAMKLSKVSYENLLGRLAEVFEETARFSEREGLKSSKQELHDVTALFAAVDQGVFTDNQQ